MKKLIILCLLTIGCGSNIYYDNDACKVRSIQASGLTGKNMKFSYRIDCNSNGLLNTQFYSDTQYKIDESIVFKSVSMPIGEKK